MKLPQLMRQFTFQPAQILRRSHFHTFPLPNRNKISWMVKK